MATFAQLKASMMEDSGSTIKYQRGCQKSRQATWQDKRKQMDLRPWLPMERCTKGCLRWWTWKGRCGTLSARGISIRNATAFRSWASRVDWKWRYHTKRDTSWWKREILVTHDESTFNANDGKRQMWIQNDSYAIWMLAKASKPSRGMPSTPWETEKEEKKLAMVPATCNQPEIHQISDPTEFSISTTTTCLEH